jgi:iron complex outermembrane recepter protein
MLCTSRVCALTVIFGAAVFIPRVVLSQGAVQDTTPPADTISRHIQTLAPVVSVSRDAPRSVLELPFAITSVRPDSARPGQQHLAIDQTLFGLPGVLVANRSNPSQDARIAIRGFGARSQFGVRSIRILRDGMPITLADGQTPLDYIDLESVGRLEIIRGTAASLYGNASGGVIDIRSSEPPADAFAAQLRSWGGSYETSRFTGVLGGSFRNGDYEANVGHTSSNNYREYSDQRLTNAYARTRYRSGGTEWELQALGLDMPTAQNPGALTAAQADSAPWMADPSQVRKHARKEVQQLQIGLSARHALMETGELSGQVFGGGRSLYNPLTFAIVGIGRSMWGGGARATAPVKIFGLANRASVGVDVQGFSDHRQNWANCNGVAAPTASCVDLGNEKGAVQLDQQEKVSSVGPFIRDEIEFGDRLNLSAGVRADYVRFEVDDNVPVTADDPDDSGERTLHQFSPMVGLVARLTPLHSLYANVSTAFETPTTTELGNQADGSAGINPDLKPQLSTTYEIGIKGVVLQRFSYNLSGFDTEVRDELIPFEVPSSNGRTYYRNAGKTRRNGIEAELSTQIQEFELAASYTFSHFRFRDYDVSDVQYAGNVIAGVPSHQVQASATWRHRSIYALVEGIGKTSVFVDDGNSAQAAGYAIANIRVGGTAVFGLPWLSPSVGVQNVFDKHYIGSVALNAAGGKFYEPSAGRAVYVGLTLGAGR